MMLQSIIVSIIGFLSGGLILLVIGSISIKFFVRRIIREAVSEETKTRFGNWIHGIIQTAIQDGVGEAVEDDKIRTTMINAMEIAIERLKEEEKEKEKEVNQENS